MGFLVKLDRQLHQFPWLFRIFAGFLLVFGFYAWIVFGLGVFGKINIITDAVGVRADIVNIEPIITTSKK